MPILESKIENAVVRWADRHGVLHLKLNVMLRRGWPDQIFFIPGGRPVLIEFKRLGKRPRKLQAYTIRQLKNRGYDVYYYDKAEEAIARINAHISHT